MKIKDKKYIRFVLDGRQYAIPVMVVKQITGISSITYIPMIQRAIKGFINLKGKIVPVLDMRVKLGLDELPYNNRTHIIVIEVDVGLMKKQIGLAVDWIFGVEELQQSEVEPIHRKDGKAAEFSVWKAAGRNLILIDVLKLVDKEERRILEQI